MFGRYFVVTLNCGPRNPPNEAIEGALAPPFDWLRFSRDCYFVYAFGSSASAIYNLLRPLLHSEDLILVSEVDAAQRYGWVSQLAVNWFTKYRA